MREANLMSSREQTFNCYHNIRSCAVNEMENCSTVFVRIQFWFFSSLLPCFPSIHLRLSDLLLFTLYICSSNKQINNAKERDDEHERGHKKGRDEKEKNHKMTEKESCTAYAQYILVGLCTMSHKVFPVLSKFLSLVVHLSGSPIKTKIPTGWFNRHENSC